MLSARGNGRSPATRGFTLLELLVVVVVMGLLTAILAPQVIGRLSEGQGAALHSQLSRLSAALLAHRQDVGRYPRTLRQLSLTPAAGSRDSCNRPYAGGIFDRWKGPYIDREIPASGMPVGSSVVRDAIRRDPAGYSETGTLLIDVTGVDREIADQLEQSLDGNANPGAGTVRWTDTGAGQGTLTYAVLARGC